jgi:hypothetical protein
VFGTADLEAADWIVMVAVASTVLVVDEVRKLVLRKTGRGAVGAS